VGVVALLLLALTAANAQSVRYRVEIAGHPVGWAELSLTCAGDRCQGRWESALRLPEETGGSVATRRIDLELDAAMGGRRVRGVARDLRGERRWDREAKGIPTALATWKLAGLRQGERRCLDAFEEESDKRGTVCATRSGPWLEGEALGVPIRWRVDSGPPQEIELPSQRTRFVADGAAALPARPPRIYGSAAVGGVGSTTGGAGDAAADAAGNFCGSRKDPEPTGSLPVDLPIFSGGGSCQEQTARFLAELAQSGRRGRHAVGVAWDGTALVWHEWAEVESGTAWVAVDPAFRQAPAKGPRFTVARFETNDAPARARAGARVLDCWRLEPTR
jgi:hypothetical protein